MQKKPTYLSVDALKEKLHEYNMTTGTKIKVGKTRSLLLEACKTAGIINEYEFLATRNATDTRRAWMVYELERVGCTLRADSKLCQAYIENDQGDPVYIASVMAEMKFYFEETEYETIREEMFNKAQEEYELEMDSYNNNYNNYDHRPRFHDYFDSQETSNQAKDNALEKWIKTATQGKIEIALALTKPVVPATLRTRLENMLKLSRFQKWISSIGVSEKALHATTIYTQLESIALANAFPYTFEATFGTKIRQLQKVYNARQILHGFQFDREYNSVYEKVLPFALKTIAPGFDSKRACKICQAAMQMFMEGAIKMSFQDWLKNNNNNNNHNNNIKHSWICTLCNTNKKKNFGYNGLIDHSKNMHKIIDETEINAIAMVWSQTQVNTTTFFKNVVCAMKRECAASRIQRQWHLSIACPEYAICKKRLLTEISSLENENN